MPAARIPRGARQSIRAPANLCDVFQASKCLNSETIYGFGILSRLGPLESIRVHSKREPKTYLAPGLSQALLVWVLCGRGGLHILTRFHLD